MVFERTSVNIFHAMYYITSVTMLFFFNALTPFPLERL